MLFGITEIVCMEKLYADGDILSLHIENWKLELELSISICMVYLRNVLCLVNHSISFSNLGTLGFLFVQEKRE